MTASAPRHAAITGTGMYVPEQVVTNEQLSRRLGEDIDAFVSGVLGIRERRVCAPSESAADLAEHAAHAALQDAGLSVGDVDLLIVATDTPEYVSPSTAAVVHGRLGSPRCGAFDINAGCAGFVTALDTAWKYIRADERYERVLVVGAYAMSKFLDYDDKKTATIFADGGGAVVLERSAEPGVLASELRADGAYCDDMGIFAGGSAEPVTAEVLESGYRNRLRFIRKYPASINEEGWPDIARSVLDRAGAAVPDVDLWLWTQVNRATIHEVMGRLGEPVEKAHTIMHKWGYTGSACLPMALHDAVAAGRVADGHLIMLTASGAGLAMGSMALRWQGRSGVRHG
jgi:3-oxoacyl-[acyl-carrier-protein] synthase III